MTTYKDLTNQEVSNLIEQISYKKDEDNLFKLSEIMDCILQNKVNWDNMLRIVIYIMKDYNIALYLINELGADRSCLAIITQIRFEWWRFRHGYKIRK